METSRGFVLKRGAFSVGDILRKNKIPHLGRLLTLLADDSVTRLAFKRLGSFRRSWFGVIVVNGHLEDTVS